MIYTNIFRNQLQPLLLKTFDDETKLLKVEKIKISTNDVYVLSIEKGNVPINVILKLYAKDSEHNVPKETKILTMMKDMGFATPDVYASFINGCLLQFIPGRPLKDREEMKQYSKYVAKELRQLHSVRISDAKLLPTTWQIIDNFCSQLDDSSQFAWIKKRKDAIVKELKEKFKGIPLVTCHHNIHPGNLMLIDHDELVEKNNYLAKDDSLKKAHLILIDYETVGLGYAIFDIVDYWETLTLDPYEMVIPKEEDKSTNYYRGYHPERFPSIHEQQSFLDAYNEGSDSLSPLKLDDQLVKAALRTDRLLWGLWAAVKAQEIKTRKEGNYDMELHARILLDFIDE